MKLWPFIRLGRGHRPVGLAGPARYVSRVLGNAIREEQAKVLNVANLESSRQLLLPSDFLLGLWNPFRSFFSATDPIVRGK